jgi:hypothetical protein
MGNLSEQTIILSIILRKRPRNLYFVNTKIIHMRRAVFLFWWGSMCAISASGQNYNAIKGSPYAGSLGVGDNPASILNTPYPWDLTLLSFQVQNATNAVRFNPVSYLSHPDSINYTVTNGAFKRYAEVNYNLHLLNLRLALGRKAGIAFGANLRGYGAARTGVANYNDSVQNMNQFFNINEGTVYNANVVTSSWLELFATYSRTVWDDNIGRLNAGVTVKGMRGISGLFAQLKSGSVDRSALAAQTIYLLNAGSGRYGYSANYDFWHNSNSTTKNIKDFLTHSQGGAAVDLGVEYLVKSQAVTNYSDGDTYYDYEWKIGVSLLDLGENRYQYGTQSRAASNPRSDVSDSALNAKFDNAGTLANFNDSLATIVNSFTQLNGSFAIWNPARLVINVDRPLQDQFAVNGSLTLNLGGSNTGKRLFVKDMNLLTLTPRWETRNLGAYLPMLVTTDGKFWVGGALKAGPLLLGVHNWANIFSKSKIQNGGFYLALVLRPGQGFSLKEDKKYSCPKY